MSTSKARETVAELIHAVIDHHLVACPTFSSSGICVDIQAGRLFVAGLPCHEAVALHLGRTGHDPEVRVSAARRSRPRGPPRQRPMTPRRGRHPSPDRRSRMMSQADAPVDADGRDPRRRSQLGAVEFTLRCQYAVERRDNGGETLRSRVDDIARDEVCIDHDSAELTQDGATVFLPVAMPPVSPTIMNPRSSKGPSAADGHRRLGRAPAPSAV